MKGRPIGKKGTEDRVPMVFDITFSQFALVLVVGAAVIGPRDLPKAARSAGQMMGTAVRFIVNTRSQAEKMMQETQIPEVRLSHCCPSVCMLSLWNEISRLSDSFTRHTAQARYSTIYGADGSHQEGD